MSHLMSHFDVKYLCRHSHSSYLTMSSYFDVRSLLKQFHISYLRSYYEMRSLGRQYHILDFGWKWNPWVDILTSPMSCWFDISWQAISCLTSYFDVRSLAMQSHIYYLITHFAIGSLSKQTHISFWRAFSWHTISYFILPWDLLASNSTSHILLPCGISGQAMSRLLSYNSFEIGSLGRQCHDEVFGQTMSYLMVCEFWGQTISYPTSDIRTLMGYDAGY